MAAINRQEFQGMVTSEARKTLQLESYSVQKVYQPVENSPEGVSARIEQTPRAEFVRNVTFARIFPPRRW